MRPEPDPVERGVELRKQQPTPGLPGPAEWIEVGEFRQGSQLSQWMLARYLVGRAVAETVGLTMLLAGLILLAGAGVLWWQHWDLTWLKLLILTASGP